ncbi:hypothetical protein KP509_23G028800 [Ceratopteris richardii]|uniref:Cryptochrome 1 n=1 Tax=Ceratopteris richardii TaxID=49495 RepID=A0A8T2S184_CERRI|nr:hypothetical protein KP509_23G028800 [Ceratopteris richardii]
MPFFQIQIGTQVDFCLTSDPISLVRDHRVKQELVQAGISVTTFNADLLYEPWEINDEHGQPYTTFGSFWSHCMDRAMEPDAPILPPKRLVSWPGTITSLPIEELELENESEKGSNDLLARAWSPGWANADRALEAFVNGPLMDYASNSQKVDSATTSLLSPHLHYGELSVRKIFHCIRMKQVLWVKEGNIKAEESVNLYLRAIGFREYSRYLSFNFPFTHERSLLSNLKYFPWRNDEGYFKVWRQGRTGYPLVDAGMRELWATGWLHNRIRVIVSNFFVKFLQLPWRWGMKYFWDTLLDADLESDVLGWQYISGSLPDGHELQRMDNPQFEGYKYDPHGEYVRRWLPELSRLPSEWIHHPWDAPPNVLRAAGIELGSNYPRPIVEVAAARARLEQSLTEMTGRGAAARAAGLEDTVGLDGCEPSQADNMDVDRHPHHNAERNVSVKSPYDQLVPSLLMETGRGAATAFSSHAHEGHANGPVRCARTRAHMVTDGNRLPSQPPSTGFQGVTSDTTPSVESSSAHMDRSQSNGVILPSWPRHRQSHSTTHQDDSQVPLVPELRHRVLST